MESIHKDVTVRVPVSVYRGWERGSTWQAAVKAPTGESLSWWSAGGKNQAEAVSNLTALVAAGMARMEERPIVVIGGDEQYASCIHLIRPTTVGYVVEAIRNGRHAVSSGTSATTLQETLDEVLRHVGGEPKVVRL